MINCFIKKRGERATGFWNYKFARGSRCEIGNYVGDGKHQRFMRANSFATQHARTSVLIFHLFECARGYINFTVEHLKEKVAQSLFTYIHSDSSIKFQSSG